MDGFFFPLSTTMDEFSGFLSVMIMQQHDTV